MQRLSFLTLLLLAAPVSAQFRVNPNVLENQPALSTYGVARPVAVPVPAFNPGFGGMGGFGPGGWFGGMTPAFGYLSGMADLTTANAQYQVTIQQARLLNEQALRSQLDTRRAVIEQLRWEYETTPSLETQRERSRELAVRRSLNNPPLSEILAGDALNTLLEQARRNAIMQVPGPLIPLDPLTLKHINVTNGATTGGSQVAREQSNLTWPLPLQDPRFNDLRQIINTAMDTAAGEARAGGIQFGTDKKLNDAIRDLDQKLDDSVAEMTPSDFIRSRRFVTQLKDARKTLGDASAASYLTGKWAARGDNVAELCKNMTDSGLRFAPGLSGDEAYYRSLHASMSAFVASQGILTAQASQSPRTPSGPPR